jgi:hypothetical protein
MEVINHADYIGKKIKVDEYSGIIKYSGPLKHEVRSPRIKKDAHWLGIEWDQPTRGIDWGA